MTSKLVVSADFGTMSMPVGELYLLNGRIYFTYDKTFPSEKYRLSPFMLSTDKELAHHSPDMHLRLFWGLHGVFADSLPDGWGLLLIKRTVESQGTSFNDLTGLDLLTFIGNRGLGVLRYEPIREIRGKSVDTIDFLELERESERILEGDASEILSTLIVLGGSPGGARPKVLVGIKELDDGRWSARSGADKFSQGYRPWIVKFAAKEDTKESAIVEFLYTKAAESLDIQVPRHRLFEVENHYFFGSERFDQNEKGECFHMHSLAGMLHADFRMPALDYKDFLAVISRLTKDNAEILRGYRLAVFNCIFHNRDDHAKNFTFLMDQDGNWHLAPAYDLTYSAGVGGEHMTSVLGQGKDIGSKELLSLAKEFKISSKVAKDLIEATLECRGKVLEDFRTYGIEKHPLQIFARLKN